MTIDPGGYIASMQQADEPTVEEQPVGQAKTAGATHLVPPYLQHPSMPTVDEAMQGGAE